MGARKRQFTLDFSSASQRRAIALADADERLRATLVALRRRLGLSQHDLAERMGIRQSSVAAFERYDNDPRLSTLRRYAHAVGATVEHTVTFNGLPVDTSWSALGDRQFNVSVTATAARPSVPVAADPKVIALAA